MLKSKDGYIYAELLNGMWSSKFDLVEAWILAWASVFIIITFSYSYFSLHHVKPCPFYLGPALIILLSYLTLFDTIFPCLSSILLALSYYVLIRLFLFAIVGEALNRMLSKVEVNNLISVFKASSNPPSVYCLQ